MSSLLAQPSHIRSPHRIGNDIRLKVKNGRECKALGVLVQLFDEESKCYEGNKNVLGHVIDEFQRKNGFSSLAEYLTQRKHDSRCMPLFEILQCLIEGLSRVSKQQWMQERVKPKAATITFLTSLAERKKGVALVSQAIFDYVKTFPIKRKPIEILQLMVCLADMVHLSTQHDFQEFHRHLALDVWNTYIRSGKSQATSKQVGDALARAFHLLPGLAVLQVVEALKWDCVLER